jgi:site-specific recombinase XerC
MNPLDKYLDNLSWELKLNNELTLEEIKSRLKTLVDLAKIEGQKELNHLKK